ncbi:hypothetical protein V6N13_071260 [Hibiscus sabdariffa]
MLEADSSPREVQQTDTESPVDFVEAVAAQFPEDDQHHASPTPACEEGINESINVPATPTTNPGLSSGCIADNVVNSQSPSESHGDRSTELTTLNMLVQQKHTRPTKLTWTRSELYLKRDNAGALAAVSFSFSWNPMNDTYPVA